MPNFLLPAIVCLILISGGVHGQLLPRQKVKKASYEEVTFEDLTKRYLEKETPPGRSIEGIYSVSSVITRKGPHLLTGEVRERVIERRENYARIAILKERPGSSREYIEVSLSYREAGTYPVMGEFNIFGDGRGLIYKHIEPDGSSMSFSMTHDPDLLEGEFSIVEGKSTITYHLSFLRIYPNRGRNLSP